MDDTPSDSIERWLALHDERIGVLREHRDGIERQIRELADEASIDVPSTQSGKVRTPQLVKPITREELERRRVLVADEITAHETLVSLARDRRVRETLAEVLGNPRSAEEAAADPRAFARSRSIELPRTMGIQLRIEGDRTTVLIGYRTETFTTVLELGRDDIE